MNVVILANELNYTCGVTNHLIHLSKGLIENKMNVKIITGGGNGIDRLQQIGADVHVCKYFHHTGRSLAGFMLAVFYLISFCRKNNIKIVHSHYHYGANIAHYAKLFTGIRTIQTNHGIIGNKGRLKHFNANTYIAINEHIREHILNNNIADESKICFIRCGIPVAEQLAEKSKAKIRFVFASRLIEEKGADTFIRAVSLLNASIKAKCEFIIAGEGKEEAILKKLNDETNAGVRFTGRVKNIYELLEQSHSLVYCSKSVSEGFPAIITEAGATGNIVITTRFRGYDSVLKDGVNCLMFDTGDAEQLKSIIQQISENYDDYKHLAYNLYTFIKCNFSTTEMIAKHIALYSKLSA